MILKILPVDGIDVGRSRYQNTKVACPGGCTIKTVQVSSVLECQALCNTTVSCVTITIDHGSAVKSCALLSSPAPGTGDSDHDTYVRVADSVRSANPIRNRDLNGSNWVYMQFAYWFYKTRFGSFSSVLHEIR